MAKIIQFPTQRKQEIPVFGTAGTPSTDVCVGNTVLLFPGVERKAPPAPSATPEKSTKRKRGISQEEDQRQGLYAKINIALRGNSKTGESGLFAKLEHFDEDFYRNELDVRYNLKKRFDRVSAADLELHELEQVVKWLSGLGWKMRKGKHRKDAPETLFHDPTGMSREDRMGKIEAFLAEKARVEKLEHLPWGYAVKILKNQTANDPDGQVTTFEKANPKQLDGVIAALYRNAKRRGRRVR